MLVLKRDPKAQLVAKSAGFLWTREVWQFKTGKMHRREPLTEEQYRAVLSVQQNIPVRLMQGDGKAWWIFRNEFYWEDEALASDQVKVLILDRDLRNQKKLELAHARLSAVASQVSKGRQRDPLPDDVKVAVWRRDQGKCAKCGSPERLEFDHIIPVVMGGSNTVRNVRLLCEGCNREKGGSLV